MSKTRARKSTTSSKFYSADQLMRDVADAMARDFHEVTGTQEFASFLKREGADVSISELRATSPAVDFTDGNAHHFKMAYQMANLLKRYRFEKDLYTEKELEAAAIAGFLETQTRLQSLDLDNVKPHIDWILDTAAGYIAKVLGEYDGDEHRSRCRFGSKASVGVPARSACEAARWELPITGSSQQISWFDEEIRHAEPCRKYIQDQIDSDPSRSAYREISALALTLVPKTFKSLRSIMPNTTIGSYMSYGLGEMIRIRLKRHGFDIRSLQERHKYLAMKASVTQDLVTADLSSASDSITEALVRRLFPPDWVSILEASRIGQVVLPDKRVIQSLTFCTMGVGYTFPLQTLVFLSLLKATEQFLFGKRNRRTISVYGDDLIYSRRMHETVVRVFSEVGFVVNLSKTHVEDHFRESCGGDYLRGVDVRPFQPQNGPAKLGRNAYEAMLYKYTNGLLRRWTEHEIRGTLRLLMNRLAQVTHGVKIVPPDFGDDGGVRIPYPFVPDFLSGVRIVHPKTLGHGVYRFVYLSFKAEYREENRHAPYLWSVLRGQKSNFDYARPGIRGLRESFTQCVIDYVTGADSESVPALHSKEDRPIKYVRSKVTGVRFRRTLTYVTINHTGKYTRQSGTSCFEVRRQL